MKVASMVPAHSRQSVTTQFNRSEHRLEISKNKKNYLINSKLFDSLVIYDLLTNNCICLISSKELCWNNLQATNMKKLRNDENCFLTFIIDTSRENHTQNTVIQNSVSVS